MSTKRNDGHDAHMKDGAPYHETVTFEPRDINISTVVKQLIYLGIMIVASLLICIPILNFLTKASAEGDVPMPAIRATMHMENCDSGAFPPEPRLQGVPCHEKDPQQDMREKLAEDNAANDAAGWVDKENGVAKIPVKDAMTLIVEKAAVSPDKTGNKPEKK